MRNRLGCCLVCGVLLCLNLGGCDQAPTKMNERKVQRVDYLPLRVGKSWSYDYFYGFRQTGAWDSVMYGSLTWVVSIADTVGNPKQYEVRAILSGQSIKIDHRFGTSDTALVAPDTSSFLILEDASSALAIAPAFFDSRTQFSDSIMRYGTENSADTLFFRFADRHPVESVHFVRNLGITAWNFSRTGNYGASGTLKLK